jgi:DNA-binding NarL/FixJ family response regulator
MMALTSRSVRVHGSPAVSTQTMPDRLTVLIADDDREIRKSLRSLLLFSAVSVVAEADNGRDAVKLAILHRPQVVLMDISMPLMDGFEATRQISVEVPEVRVVIVSAHCDSSYVDHAVQAGAVGFLVKTAVVWELAEAIQAVAANGRFVSSLVRIPS